MSDHQDQPLDLRPKRRPQLSAHNWHSWSMPPTARVPFQLVDSAELQAKVESALRPSCTAAESMVELLCSMGLCTFFGLPGGPIIPIFDAILSNEKARLVEPRHETYGTFSAMGYYRATGQVPVVVVTAGPGATNVVTGVVSAHLERIPMVVICGDVPWATTGRKMFQDSGEDGVGIERMLKGVTRAVVRIAQPASASSQVLSALRAATNPDRPGPALIVVSIDRAGTKVTPPEVFSAAAVVTPAAPSPALLSKVTASLRRARRPLLLVGSGCRKDADSVLRMAEAIGAPFVTTPQGKGLLPEDHPLSLRTCGIASSLWARRYMNAGADVTLVLGTDLDDMSTAGTPPVADGGELIHVDSDACVFARNFPTAIGAHHDVGAFATALAAYLQERPTGLDSRALLLEARAGSPFDVTSFAEDTSVPIAPHRAISDLQRAAGPNTIFVADMGEHMLHAVHYLTMEKGRRYLMHLGLGSMGSGISSAVGLALGDPSRRVVCICGDGGMQMAGMEILVAIKLRLPVIYAILNDARYNMVYHGYKVTFGKPAAWETPSVDFARWAEALGARGKRIERPGEITGELLDALTADGTPAVLDIHHDADMRIRNAGRVEALRDLVVPGK